jgi:hypothetical protein
VLDEFNSRTFPDIEWWQQFRETGELPPDLVERMEGTLRDSE